MLHCRFHPRRYRWRHRQSSATTQSGHDHVASTTWPMHHSHRKQFSAVVFPAHRGSPVHAQLLGGSTRPRPSLSVLCGLREAGRLVGGAAGMRLCSNSGRQRTLRLWTARANDRVYLRRRRHRYAVCLLSPDGSGEAISTQKTVQRTFAYWIKCSTSSGSAASSGVGDLCDHGHGRSRGGRGRGGFVVGVVPAAQGGGADSAPRPGWCRRLSDTTQLSVRSSVDLVVRNHFADFTHQLRLIHILWNGHDGSCL